MDFLKSAHAHSLIFKMLKNAGKSWKILFTLIIPRALNFSAFFRDLLQGRPRGFFFLVCAGFESSFSWASSMSFFRVLVSLSVSSAEPELVMADVEPTVFFSPADIFCVAQKKKKRRAPSHIWTDEETGVFLSLMQGDETTIGYFNRMKLKSCRGRRAWPEITRLMRGNAFGVTAVNCYGFVAIFTMVIRDEWPVSFDYAIVIHSTQSKLKNSIHSIQKLMNGPSVFIILISSAEANPYNKKKKRNFLITWTGALLWGSHDIPISSPSAPAHCFC